MQDFEGVARTWSVALGDKYGCVIPPTEHPIMGFLVEYIGGLHNIWHKSREDGATPFKRIRGKDSQARLIPFEEKVLHKTEKGGRG